MKTTWYLWAVDDDPTTNDYLVGVIGEQNPELLHQDELCADGVVEIFSNVRMDILMFGELSGLS